MQLPIIYIVTPCLNAEKTISKTIASIVEQKGAFNLRLHAQDGVSTDGTLHILSKWKQRLDRGYAQQFNKGVELSWESAPDSGLYDAIAKGVEYIAPSADAFMGWLNADDILQPSACAILASVSSLDEVDWITGQSLRVNLDGETTAYMPHGVWPQCLLASGACDGQMWHCLQQEGTFWRKALWDAVGGLNTGYRLAGDWDLWRRFAQHTEVVHAPQALAGFCQHNQQLSHRQWNGYCSEVAASVSLQKRRAAIRQALLSFKRTFKTASLVHENGRWRVVRTSSRATCKNFLILLFASSFFSGALLSYYRRFKDALRNWMHSP